MLRPLFYGDMNNKRNYTFNSFFLANMSQLFKQMSLIYCQMISMINKKCPCFTG